MGANASTAVGPKSTHKEESSDEVDYKDPRNEQRAKAELYTLFQEDKIIHVAKLEEAEARIQTLERENAELKSTLDKYKTLNQLPAIPRPSSPVPTPLTPRPPVAPRPVRPQQPEGDVRRSSHEELRDRINRLAAKIKEGQLERRASSHPLPRRMGFRSSHTATTERAPSFELGRVEEGDELPELGGASGSGN